MDLTLQFSPAGIEVSVKAIWTKYRTSAAPCEPFVHVGGTRHGDRCKACPILFAAALPYVAHVDRSEKTSTESCEG